MNSAKSFFAPHARGLSPLAGLGWLADVVGAALFAGCLSLYIAALAGAEGVIGPFWLLGGLVLGGLLRAAAQGVAAVAGQGNANRVKARLRAAVYARLLPTAQRRGALAGEDLRVAVDNIEACEGYFARFLPLRRASALAPLLVALLVAPASWVSTAIMLATLV
ncbi:MAG: hypothetical protein IE917_22095, partial [Betaproteobacteria bacterium]|nr:hypothetical protein [Betaproteobacteria bacterium]